MEEREKREQDLNQFIPDKETILGNIQHTLGYLELKKAELEERLRVAEVKRVDFIQKADACTAEKTGLRGELAQLERLSEGVGAECNLLIDEITELKEELKELMVF